MRIVTLGATLAAVVVTAVAVGCAAADYPPAFPRAGATLVLDNPWVSAWDVHYVSGQPTPMHRHGLESAGIELADSSVTVTTPDGASQSFPSRRGESYFMTRGTTHVELTPLGVPPRHAVIIELKDAAPVASTAAASAPGAAFADPAARKVAENPRAILWDYAWPSSRPAPAVLTHNTVFVIIDGGELAGAGPDGGARVVAVTSGQVLFQPAGAALPAARGPVHAVVLELK